MKVPAGWYVILSSTELKKNRPTAIERFGRSLVVWRKSSGEPVITSDQCPHRGVKLSLGTINKDCIVCPFHGFEFDSTGACQLVPETKKSAVNLTVPTFSATEKHGFIWMWLGEEATSATTQTHWFDELENPKLVYSEHSDVWPIHVTRCIENQLDYAHLPYLHRNSIGRGFDVSIKRDFQLDDMQITLGFKDGGGFQFKFPNIWRLVIKPGSFYQMLAFVPINEQSTKIYARSYQSFVTFGGLKPLIDIISNYQNSVILNQDKYAVISHSPNSSIDATNEKLYPSDHGIDWFRKKWLEKSAKTSAGQN
ncbi:MAG: hypothetical protein QG574_4405 [Cyanobacteriota bacterium erpe_2018_sw_21hr_WHONDRS-SW48-000092_B_bin.40]|nr:hypothetical protein [Cyanobacteriota bacterium erpe_2018_sw_21hr_WHONDRS-SW48-000092_B_bin.40]